MKRLSSKIIIVLSILIIFFIIFLLLIKTLKKNNNEFIIGKTLEIENSSDYLVQYENGDYYLMKANADITFLVTSDGSEVKYKIFDEEEKEVKTTIKKKKKYYEIASSNHYEAGKTYKMVLENGVFVDEKLKKIETLYFTIVRPNANTQILNEKVIKVDNNIITNILEKDHYYQITSNLEYKKGDILYYQNKNDVMVFKIDNIISNNGTFIMDTQNPTLEEIFKELDIYGEFNLNITDFIPNDDLKDYIEVAIEKSDLFNNIIPSVKADSLFDINIRPQSDGSARVNVSILLKSDEFNPFNIKILKKHDIKLEFELIVKLKVHADIRFVKQDIGANIEIELGSGISISNNDDTFKNFKEAVNKKDIDINEVRNKLKELKQDESKDDLTIGVIPIKTPILGLNVNFKLDFVKEIEVALEAIFNTKSDINIMFGYNNENGFYRNYDVKSKPSPYEILGKGEVKLGFEPNINISYMKLFEAGIKGPFGLYGEGEINYIKASNQDVLDGYFEIGTFLDIDLYAKISAHKLNLAEVTYKISEIKIPIIKLEGKIKDECEEKILNRDFSCYEGIYTNVDDSNSNIKIDKKGIVGVKSYTMNGTISDAKIVNIDVDNGIYKLEYDVGDGTSENGYYIIVPIGVDYKYERFPCDDDYNTCSYDSDSSKVRIIHYVMSWGEVYERQ